MFGHPPKMFDSRRPGRTLSHVMPAPLTYLATRLGSPVPDADLLARFVHDRDDAAFAVLVNRHGPTVFGVCRRILGNSADAEDSFQAVFLVLVNRAAALTGRRTLGDWLYGVAVRTSFQARVALARRRKHERAAAERRPESAFDPIPSEPSWIDRELSALPDKFREPVVLCLLQDRPRAEVAAELGIPEGTLASRLDTARKRLADRLARHRVPLVLTGLLVPVPAAVATSTLSRAADGAGMAIHQLANEVTRSMITNSKWPVLVAAGVLTAAIGGLLLAVGPEPAERYAPVPKAEKEGKILFWLDEKPLLLKPDGTELPSPDPIEIVGLGIDWGNAQLSPDGKRVGVLKQGSPLNVAPPKAVPPGTVFSDRRTTLHVLDLEGKKEAKSLDAIAAGDFRWLGDGSKLYVYGSEIGDGDVPSDKAGPMVYDLATGKRTPLKLPDQFHVMAFGPDGKTAILEEVKSSDTVWHRQIHLWAVGSKDKPTPLLDLNDSVSYPRFSPDGNRLLCHTSHATHTPQGNGVWNVSDTKFSHVVVIDLATKKQAVVRDLSKEAEWRLAGLAWSPDGQKIAYLETKNVPRPPRARRDSNPFRVTVADPDGKDGKEIYKAEGSWLVGFDWR